MNNLHIILLIVILVLLVFIYKRERFLNYSICETVPDGDNEQCLSYGCEMKQIKAEAIRCLDPDGDRGSCKVRRETNIKKLNNILESVELSKEEIYSERLISNQANHYLRLVKPGKSFKNYLKEEDSEKAFEFYPNSMILSNNIIESWPNNRSIVYNDNTNSKNLVKILTVDNLGENNIRVKINNVDISQLKFKNGRYLDQINSFDYCYKLGGNEVNISKSYVQCNNPVDYNKCEKVKSNGLGSGCFHNRSKEACLFNTNDNKENNCKWISSYSLPENKNINYYQGYCVDKKYKIDNECLFKNKNECRSSSL